jgi:hypothetical protein
MRDTTGTDFDPTLVRHDGLAAASSSELFNAEEMQAIREQYEERVAAAEERAEELEFQVKRALAAVRDAENDLKKIRASLEGLVGGGVDENTLKNAVRPRHHTPAPIARHAPVIGEPIMGLPGGAPKAPKAARPSTLPGRPDPAPAMPPAKLGPPPIPPSAKSRGPLPPRQLNGYKRLVA